MKILPRIVTLAVLSGLMLVAARAAETAGTVSPAPAATPSSAPNCSQMSSGRTASAAGGKIQVPIYVACTAETLKNNPACAQMCAENAAWAANPNPKPVTPGFRK